MKYILIILILLLCTSCITGTPVFSEQKTLFDTVAVNLTYSKDEPKNRDVALFISSIKRYSIARDVIVLKRKIELDEVIWSLSSINVYRNISRLKALTTLSNTLYLTMSYLPGIYLNSLGNRAVGLALPKYNFTAIFYGHLDKKSVRPVMTHELMHIVGLEHCSNKRCIMYPVISSKQRILKQGCLDKLKKILDKD